MSFKLPSPPSSQAEIYELADFAELLAWKNGSTSMRQVMGFLIQNDENDNNVGCEDNDDEIAVKMDEMMNEIDRRMVSCAGGYPFKVSSSGHVLAHCAEATDLRSFVYLYCLLATRLNMAHDRLHAAIDGANLLEEISTCVLNSYLGLSRSVALAFGTSVGGSFKDRINHLCKNIGEGKEFHTLDEGSVAANDDGVDTVAWIPFRDNLPCKLIVFGQCKTGTMWRTHSTRVQPSVFVKKWMKGVVILDPLRAFFVSEAADRAHWNSNCLETGLFFDRCRIVDFCEFVPDALDAKIRSWTIAALEFVANSTFDFDPTTKQKRRQRSRTSAA